MSLLNLTVELNTVQVTEAIAQYLARLGFAAEKCTFNVSKNYDMFDRESGESSFSGATVQVTQTKMHTVPHSGEAPR